MNRRSTTCSTPRRWRRGRCGDLRRATDLIESETHSSCGLDLPGLSEDDVNIEFEGNVLSVSGERKSEHEHSWAGLLPRRARLRQLPPVAASARRRRRRRRSRRRSTRAYWRSPSPSPRSPRRTRSRSPSPTSRRRAEDGESTEAAADEQVAASSNGPSVVSRVGRPWRPALSAGTEWQVEPDSAEARR